MQPEPGLHGALLQAPPNRKIGSPQMFRPVPDHEVDIRPAKRKPTGA